MVEGLNLAEALNNVWYSKKDDLKFVQWVAPPLANMIVNMPKKFRHALEDSHFVMIFRCLVLLELFGVMTRQQSYKIIGKQINTFAWLKHVRREGLDQSLI